MKRVVLWLDVAFFVILSAVDIFFRPHTAIWYAGLSLAAAGFPLWMTARRQLGAAFTHKACATILITRGLYSKIRHPVYVFGLLAYLGAFLALQVWLIFILWLVLTPFELLRIRREEKTLREAFGDEYERYRQSTWF